LVSTVNTKTVVDKTSVLEIRSQRLNDAVDAELAALRRVMETSPSRNWIRPQNRNRTTGRRDDRLQTGARGGTCLAPGCTVNSCLKRSAGWVAVPVVLLSAAGCNVFTHAAINRIGGYRFEVFHADRFTSKSYDRIEIGFRVYGDGDEQSRAPFDEAFNSRMRVVDNAGATFPVIVQPMKRTGAQSSIFRGYLGIVKLGGRHAPTAATPLDDFRLVIESPDPLDRGATIEVGLRF
jgi:hypothetical protein